MFNDFLISNFEILVFISVLLIVIGFFLLFFYQSYKFEINKTLVVNYYEIIKKSNLESKGYLADIASILEIQKNEILKITDKISFLEREINRLGSIKGSEDVLGIAIDMARKGEDKESIKNKTNLRDDEIEAIYTYYRK
tara:strand:- start:318 stop:734 length:417 start_codon:yes stop_codon:yes gene_type:complete